MTPSFRDEDFIQVICYHTGDGGDFEGEDNFDTMGLQVDNHFGTRKVSFIDDNLLLGSTPHNRPLFVTGYVCEQKVNRILVDDCSAVNILLLKAMKGLRVPLDEFMQSHLMIERFNQ